MSMTESNLSQVDERGLYGVRENWGWFLGLGTLLVVIGIIAIGSATVMTALSVLFLGWLLIIGGVVQSIHAFWRKGFHGFFIDLLAGLLYVVVGFLMVANPAVTAAALTLLIAMFLLFGGLFRIVAAIAVRTPHWGWVLFNGVISLVLGILIWRQWPLSGLWVIGLFVGIDMLFNGWALIMLGIAAKSLPAKTAES